MLLQLHRYCALVALLIVLGCQGYSVTGGPGRTVNPKLMSTVSEGAALLRVNSILVTPIVFSPQARIAQHLDQQYEDALEEALAQNVGVKIERAAKLAKSDLASDQRYKGEGQMVKAVGTTAVMTQQQAMALARSHGLDSVIIATVNDFKERSGSAAGSSDPARVDLSMQLFSVGNGSLIWAASYHFKDEAITDNLFRLSDHVSGSQTGNSGIGWRSAHEVLRAALAMASSDLGQKRASSFGVREGDAAATR